MNRSLDRLAWASALLLLSAAGAAAHDEVLAPNGGETYQAGELVSIRWTGSIQHALVSRDVLFSSTGPQGPWVPLATGLPPGDPSPGSAHCLEWVVPDMATSAGSILVRMHGTGGAVWEAPNSTGLSSTLHLLGSPSAWVNELSMAVVDLPPGVFGFALNSDTVGFVPFAGGGQGNLCLWGTIGRHLGQVMDSGPLGYVSLPIGLTALPRGGQTAAAVAGQTVSFQWWHRDSTPALTSNLSDALSLTLR